MVEEQSWNPCWLGRLQGITAKLVSHTGHEYTSGRAHTRYRVSTQEIPVVKHEISDVPTGYFGCAYELFGVGALLSLCISPGRPVGILGKQNCIF